MRIRLIDLVSFVTLLPAGVGFMAAVHFMAFIGREILLADILTPARDYLEGRLPNPDTLLNAVWYWSVLAIPDNVVFWFLAAIVVGLFAFNRSRLARVFAVVLLLSNPIVELWYHIPLGMDRHFFFAKCVTFAVGMAPSLIAILAICNRRPLSAETDDPGRQQPASWRKSLIKLLVAAATLVVSGYGWTVLNTVR